MAKVSTYPVRTPAGTDLLYVVGDPYGSPTSRATTVADVLTASLSLGNISGVVALDVAHPRTLFHAMLTGDVSGFAISNAHRRAVHEFTLEITQDQNGGRKVTWPANWKFDAGSDPTVLPTASATTIVTAYTRDGGTTVYGFLAGRGMA